MTDHAAPKVVSLGCRLNAYEGEVMSAHAQVAGLHDAIIVNTCAVTAQALRQARQTIRKARRDHPHARLIVTGCAAQLEPERFNQMAEVDHVLGNDAKLEPQTFAALAAPHRPRTIVNDIMLARHTQAHRVEGFARRARATVHIQSGCDHRCTFCIIPFARGPSRSVPASVVIEQISQLVANGYGEVVLTGVDITSYGADLAPITSLGRLTRAILAQVPHLRRLRFSSIDQVEADPTLERVIVEEPRVMPHLHLSLQSGADLILKRMRRRHVRKNAIEFCNRVRKARPDVAFGADLIAGFPTETEAHFQDTLDLVEDCGLTHLHVFPFSPRPGTPAARMPQLHGTTIKERAARLRAVGEHRYQQALAAQVGRTCEILVEAKSKGHTPHYHEARLEGAQGLAIGAIVSARVQGHDGQRLTCEVLQ